MANTMKFKPNEKSHSPVEGITLWFTTYQTAKAALNQVKFNEWIAENGIESDQISSVFGMAFPSLTNVEASENAPLWAQELARLWQVRSRSIIENWHAFESIANFEMLVALWQAYQAVSVDDLPQAAPELQAGMPVPIGDDGELSNPTQAGGK